MIKEALKNDLPFIIKGIKELAIYEKMEDQVVLNEKELHKWIFEEQIAHVYIAFHEEKPVGFMLYFYNFSTFLGKPGIYIEDIYIQEPFRNLGLGKAFFKTLIEKAKASTIERIEWSCLNWNTPSIAFYKKIGAHPMDEWSTFRLDPRQAKL